METPHNVGCVLFSLPIWLRLVVTLACMLPAYSARAQDRDPWWDELISLSKKAAEIENSSHPWIDSILLGDWAPQDGQSVPLEILSQWLLLAQPCVYRNEFIQRNCLDVREKVTLAARNIISRARFLIKNAETCSGTLACRAFDVSPFDFSTSTFPIAFLQTTQEDSSIRFGGGGYGGKFGREGEDVLPADELAYALAKVCGGPIGYYGLWADKKTPNLWLAQPSEVLLAGRRDRNNRIGFGVNYRFPNSAKAIKSETISKEAAARSQWMVAREHPETARLDLLVKFSAVGLYATQIPREGLLDRWLKKNLVSPGARFPTFPSMRIPPKGQTTFGCHYIVGVQGFRLRVADRISEMFRYYIGQVLLQQPAGQVPLAVSGDTPELDLR